MLAMMYDVGLKHFSMSGYKFILYLDNYFTKPKSVSNFRAKEIAVVGTARPKRNWPSPVLLVRKDSTYNDLYCCIHDQISLVLRWIGNNCVLLLTTSHLAEEAFMRERHRPRPTAINKLFIKKSMVWIV